ncbi:MAG: FtsX-like permease family protein, partial [Bacteroidota bacterium]
LLDSLGGTQARERNFASMVYFPRTEGTRLVQVRALEGSFPFYGEIITEPAAASSTFQTGRKALVDRTLMLQFGVEVGDSVRVGRAMFEVAGSLLRVPGQNGISATVASPVYIPLVHLEETGLIRKGSRINYLRYYQFEEAWDIDAFVKANKQRFREWRLGADTVETRKDDLGSAFEELTDFLNLVGFIALLLGCVGVASAVVVYVRDKVKSVAILRCLGASGRQAFLIFLIQIGVMGFLGAVIGSILGTLIQTTLPVVLEEFLPLTASTGISWPAIGLGILTGTVVALLFALPPLLRIRKISPLSALRSQVQTEGQGSDTTVYLVYALIGLFVLGFTWLQLGELAPALAFVGGLLAIFGLLTGLAWLTRAAVRRFFPRSWSFTWRQALANLYRPQNQTLTLLVTLGLGTTLIATLFAMQGMLLQRLEISDAGDRPNMVMFDIQTGQLDAVGQTLNTYGLKAEQEVPIITMRLNERKGQTRIEMLRDTTSEVRRWTLNREYRVTYRDSLIDSEKLVEGSWHGDVKGSSDSIFVSLEQDMARNSLKVDIGDEIIWDVQGVPLKTYVGSLREVDFARVQTNFLVVFPTGVLEDAPKFHVMMTRVESDSISAALQKELARSYPNISTIDLGLILKTTEDILDKVSFVIQFMAFFSILTGLIVLAGSVLLSRYQRMQESVLLRTLGASRRQILQINSLEYMLLGLLATLSGMVLALGATWALAFFVFEIAFTPTLWPLLAVSLGITGLAVLIGLLNSRGVVNEPPLEILRKEG